MLFGVQASLVYISMYDMLVCACASVCEYWYIGVPWHVCGGQITILGTLVFHLSGDRVSLWLTLCTYTKLTGPCASLDYPFSISLLTLGTLGLWMSIAMPVFVWVLGSSTQVLIFAH